ncbi:MAG: uncharacterized protein KVP18_004704 [Porospora cf. gigantea A]|nr:MAG: hypothetical protein KVP18_004704 [Porospora cf. gigantea A]
MGKDIWVPDQLKNRAIDQDIVYIELLPRSEWRRPETAYTRVKKAIKAQDVSPPSDSSLQRAGAVVGIAEYIGRNNGILVRLQANREKRADAILCNGEEYDSSVVILPEDKYIRGVSINRKLPWVLLHTEYVPPHLSDPQGRIVLDPTAVYIVRVTKWTVDSKLPLAVIERCLGNMGSVETVTKLSAWQHELQYHLQDIPQEVVDEANQKIRDVSNNWSNHLKGRRDFRKHVVITIDPETARDLDDAVSIKMLTPAEASVLANRPVSFPVAQVTVHIADVSLFVTPGSLLDQEARMRCLTIYFPHRCFPMLPRTLSDELCSLHPGVDKLCFSVSFYIDASSGKRLLAQDGFRPETCRGVINTACRFSYEEAQIVIDICSQEDPIMTREQIHALLAALKTLKSHTAAERAARDLNLSRYNVFSDVFGSVQRLIAQGADLDQIFKVLPGLQPIYQTQLNRVTCDGKGDFPLNDGFAWTSVVDSLLALDLVTRKIRRRRLATEESIVLHLKFQLGFFVDPLTNLPVAFNYAEHTSSHELIEELMLVCNRVAAEIIVSGPYQELAFLRNHESPKTVYAEQLQDWLKDLGLVLPEGKSIVDYLWSAKGFNELIRILKKNLPAEAVDAILLRFVLDFKKAGYTPFASLHRLSWAQEPGDTLATWRETMASEFTVPELSDVQLETAEGMEAFDDLVLTLLRDDVVAGKDTTMVGRVGHYALNFPLYSHFTSPIRRYSDILTHRMLAATLVAQQRRDELGRLTFDDIPMPHFPALRDLKLSRESLLEMLSIGEQATKIDRGSKHCHYQMQMLFFAMFLKSKGAPAIARGRLVFVDDKSCEVVVIAVNQSLTIKYEAHAFPTGLEGTIDTVLNSIQTDEKEYVFPAKMSVCSTPCLGLRVEWRDGTHRHVPLFETSDFWLIPTKDDSQGFNLMTIPVWKQDPLSKHGRNVRLDHVLSSMSAPTDMNSNFEHDV